MKISPVLALLTICAPLAAPLAARAQTAVPMMQSLPMAPPSAATSDAFLWRFAPPVGSRWTMRTFTRATSKTRMPGGNGMPAQSVDVSMIQKMTADYDVIKRDELGATTIRLTLRDYTTDATTLFDGKAVKSPNLSNGKSVNGATLTIKQASDGKVWGVAGMRAFQRRLFEASGVMDEKMITQILDATPMANDSDLIKSMSTMSGTLPASPVRVGENWSYDASFKQLPMALDIMGTRTLKSLDAEVAVIADNATFTGGNSEKNAPVLPGMGDIKVDYSQLSGVLSGSSRVQRSSGLPLETTINQTLKGKVSTRLPAANGVAAQTLTLPLDVVTSTRMVLEPR